MIRDASDATEAEPHGKPFRCYVKCLGIISDIRGLQKHLGIKASTSVRFFRTQHLRCCALPNSSMSVQVTPAIYGCFKCWMCGEKVGGKTIYANHIGLLPPGHPLRATGCPMHRPSTVTGKKRSRPGAWPLGLGPPPQRTTMELKFGCNVRWLTNSPVCACLQWLRWLRCKFALKHIAGAQRAGPAEALRACV